MNNPFESILTSYNAEVVTRLEVQSVLLSTVGRVESRQLKKKLTSVGEELKISLNTTKTYAHRIKELIVERDELASNQQKLADRAREIKDQAAEGMAKIVDKLKLFEAFKEENENLRKTCAEQEGTITDLSHKHNEQHERIMALESEVEKLLQINVSFTSDRNNHKTIRPASPQSVVRQRQSNSDSLNAQNEGDVTTPKKSNPEEEVEVERDGNMEKKETDTHEKQYKPVLDKDGDRVDVTDSSISSFTSGFSFMNDQPSTSPITTTIVPPTPLPKKCLLSDIEDLELLHVFSFLDTAEVLATAQVNRFVFQRVDELFGLDSQITQPHWKERKDLSIVTNDGKDKLAVDDSLQDLNKETIIASANTNGDTDNVDNAVTTGTGDAVKNDDSMVNFLTQFTSSLTAPAQATLLETSIDHDTGIWSSEVYDVYRPKLSTAELQAIMNLNELNKNRLKKNEEMEVEIEDLTSRLVNTETVRDFLINKLKSAESALKASLKELAQYRKQAGADSEIIEYLDAKCSDYESRWKDSNAEYKRLTSEFDIYQSTHSTLEHEMKNELQETRSNMNRIESSYKSEKKVLVREVKNLRIALDRCSDEKHVLEAQMNSIKETLALKF